MQVYNVVVIVEDDKETLSSFAFPCSDEEIAACVLDDVEELYGDTIIACAIVESQIDQGLGKQRAIH